MSRSAEEARLPLCIGLRTPDWEISGDLVVEPGGSDFFWGGGLAEMPCQRVHPKWPFSARELIFAFWRSVVILGELHAPLGDWQP